LIVGINESANRKITPTIFDGLAPSLGLSDFSSVPSLDLIDVWPRGLTEGLPRQLDGLAFVGWYRGVRHKCDQIVDIKSLEKFGLRFQIKEAGDRGDKVNSAFDGLCHSHYRDGDFPEIAIRPNWNYFWIPSNANPYTPQSFGTWCSDRRSYRACVRHCGFGYRAFS